MHRCAESSLGERLKKKILGKLVGTKEREKPTKRQRKKNAENNTRKEREQQYREIYVQKQTSTKRGKE